jgi:hypothetical protein
MAQIDVERIDGDTFRVTVREGGGETSHRVTATPEVVSGYAGEVDAERLVEASFRFLLEREPKEAILGSFALPVIERYFGDYPKVIRSYLS